MSFYEPRPGNRRLAYPRIGPPPVPVSSLSIRGLLLAGVSLAACGAHVPTTGEDPPFSIAAILRDAEALNEAHDVALQGDLAFVPGKGGALAVIDVASPREPKLVWQRSDPGALPDAETVLVEGDRLFLGTLDFHSIDIRDPRTPRFEGVVSDRARVNRINGMVRLGEYVLAANKDGWIDAFDVSRPAAPSLFTALHTRETHGLSYPHDIDRLGDLVVVVDPNLFGREGRPGQLALFRVLDESGALLAAEGWELAGRLSHPSLRGANRVQVSGDHAFVGGSLNPDASGGTPAAKGIVVDLSDAARPRIAATVDFSDVRGPNGLTLSGAVWFLAGGQTVEAYDITRPDSPRRLAVFRSEEAFPTPDDNAHDLAYRDGYLYVTSQGDNGFVILEVNHPEILQLARE